MPHRSRHALLIGNDAYADSPLRNPVNDARAVASELRRLGFETTLRTDVTKRALDEAVRGFVPTLRPDGIVVVFFAGHGLQHEGVSYLLPIDAAIDREFEIPYEAYPAQRLVDSVAGSGVRLSIIVLDACRANAVRVARAARADGLAPLSTVAFRSVRRRPQDYAIVYATEPGDVAADSGGGRNSPFTKAFVASLRVPGLSLDEVMHRTTSAVHRATGYDQRPVAHMSLTGRHVLHLASTDAAAADDSTPAPRPVNAGLGSSPARPRPRPQFGGRDRDDVDAWSRLTDDWSEVTGSGSGSASANSAGWASASAGGAFASAGGTSVSTSGGSVSVSASGGSVSVSSGGGGVRVTVNGVPVQLPAGSQGSFHLDEPARGDLARAFAQAFRRGAEPEEVANELLAFDDDTLTGVLDHLPNDLYLEVEELLFDEADEFDELPGWEEFDG